MFQTLREDICCFLERDPSSRNAFEIITCFPGLHAIWVYRLTHRLWGWKLRWLARFIAYLVQTITAIDIHPGAQIGRRLFIDHGTGIVIGETSILADDVTLYQGVTLGGISWEKVKRHPTLESGVIVGAGAKIIGSFTVGKNARIGSNAVVTKEVPPGATVVGIPGHILHITDEDGTKRPFSAYAEEPDRPAAPLAKAAKDVARHCRELEERVALLEKRLNKNQTETDESRGSAAQTGKSRSTTKNSAEKITESNKHSN